MMIDETKQNHFGKDHPEKEVGNNAAEGIGIGSAIGEQLGLLFGAPAAFGISLL